MVRRLTHGVRTNSYNESRAIVRSVFTISRDSPRIAMHHLSRPNILSKLLVMLLLAVAIAACSNSEPANDPPINTPVPPPADIVSDTALKLSIVQDGVYRLTQQDMSRAGLEMTTLSAETLSLKHLGKQVPFLIDGDALIFYGERSDSRYSQISSYILQAGEAGVLMQDSSGPAGGGAVSSITQVASVERNWLYEQRAAETPLQEGQVADTWFWQRVTNVGDDAILEFTFDIPTLVDGSAELTLNMWGLTHIADVENDHDFDLLVNGETVETVVFDGQVFHTSVVEIPTSQLKEGRNTFTVDNSVPGNVRLDQIMFNSAQLRFPAQTEAIDNRLTFGGVEGSVTIDALGDGATVLDVSNPANPTRLSNATVDGDGVTVGVSAEMQIAAAGSDGYLSAASVVPLIETDLRNSSNQADLIIVTTRALSPELDPLITARMDQGLTVKLAHVDEIYDEFGYGEVTPDAIQAFVSYAYNSWTAPAPSYLFLVGDTTTDMLGNGATRPENPIQPPANIVPSPIVDVSNAGETVADARLADTDGDKKPDLAVGRWPIDTPKEARDLVRRTLAYEEGPASDRALFTYDGTSNEFSSFTNRLIEQSALPTESAELFAGPTSDEVTQEWNDGAWLVSYVGHGSVNLWGADEVLSQEAVGGIGSDQTPPIVLQFSCLTGHFGYWEADSISESMLTLENGPVLLVASTSLTLSSHQSPFAIAFLEGLQNQDFERIGDALQSAKAGLATENNPGLQEISDTFGLIGDPSARIVRPVPQSDI